VSEKNNNQGAIFKKLMDAISNNNIDNVKKYLEEYKKYSLDVNEAIKYETYPIGPLPFACENGNVEIIELIIDYGASLVKDGYTSYPLKNAVIGNHIDAVQLLIDRGVPLNANTDLGSKSKYAVVTAAEYKRFDILRLLIDNGAKVNSEDNYYKTPLMMASMHGNFEIVKYLVAMGADVNAISGCICKGITTIIITSINIGTNSNKKF